MVGTLHRLADLSLVIFAVSTMLAIGLGERLTDVVAPLRRPRGVVLALLVNFVLAPLLAVLLSRLVRLAQSHETGLVLLGTAAGAPFLPKLAAIARGSLALSVALMLLLMALSIAFMPVALPLLAPGWEADPWSIARPLLVLLFVPLALGFALQSFRAARVDRLLAWSHKVASVSFLVFIALIVGLNIGAILGMFGSFAIATYSVFVLVMVGIGYAIGTIDRSTRSVFALCAGSRNVAAALIIAGTHTEDPAVTVMVLGASVVGLLLLLGLARAMRPAAP